MENFDGNFSIEAYDNLTERDFLSNLWRKVKLFWYRKYSFETKQKSFLKWNVLQYDYLGSAKSICSWLQEKE